MHSPVICTRSNTQGCRIDFILVSKGLLDKVTSCEIRYDLPPKWSDHVPVVCDLDLAAPCLAGTPCREWLQVRCCCLPALVTAFQRRVARGLALWPAGTYHLPCVPCSLQGVPLTPAPPPDPNPAAPAPLCGPEAALHRLNVRCQGICSTCSKGSGCQARGRRRRRQPARADMLQVRGRGACASGGGHSA